MFYDYTVQHREQRCCWNGAIEDINIIINILLLLLLLPLRLQILLILTDKVVF